MNIITAWNKDRTRKIESKSTVSVIDLSEFASVHEIMFSLTPFQEEAEDYEFLGEKKSITCKADYKGVGNLYVYGEEICSSGLRINQEVFSPA